MSAGSSCPAIGYYGVISAKPATNTWAPGQPLQIVLNVCSPSPPSSNVPIDVVAWAHICYQANFGDLGYLGTYPAGQSNATITITIPALLQSNMCSPGTYSGVLNLSLTFEDPRGANNLKYAIPLTFVFPSATPTPTSTPTQTISPSPILIPTSTPPTTPTQTTSPRPILVPPTPTPSITVTTPSPTSPGTDKTILIIGGVAAATAIGLLALFLWERKKKL